MANAQMATRFYLEARKNKNGEALIRCSISIHGKRLLTTTGITILPQAWNENRQEVRGTVAGKQVVNAKGQKAKDINAKLKAIDTFFADLELAVDKRAFLDLKRIYANEFGKGEKTSDNNGMGLFEHFDEFTLTMGAQNDWTVATFEKFTALKRQIFGFAGKNADYTNFDTYGLTNFVNYLRTKLQMKNSTIGKKLGFLKWFLKWAEGKGYNPVMDYKSFSPKLKKTYNKVVFLTWDELMTVYNFRFPELGEIITLKDMNGKKYKKRVGYESKTMSEVRDVFCFCCFTSLRYSDVANLKRQNVFSDHILITTIKTADTLKIELNKYAKTILEKYENVAFPFNKVLPVVSNQRMNEYLKEMAEICGLNEPITKTYYYGNKRSDEVKPKWAMIGTHAGRRTFICNALMMGIAPQIVMKWTGHSDYKAMKPYIDIADEAKAEAMRLFDKK